MVQKIRLLLLLFFAFILFAQEKPVEIKLFTGVQQQKDPLVISSGAGWLTGGQLNYKLTDRITSGIRVSFDYMTLKEDSVLLEWDWPYWDERYIDWMLTGASQEEVDSISTIKEYWSNDSSYHGIFNDHQWIQELSFSLNLGYKQPITERFSIYGEFGFGFNLFERRLKMVEDWTKSFTWQWDSSKVANGTYSEADIDRYETFVELNEKNPNTYPINSEYNSDSTDIFYTMNYQYSTKVTHFAPSKKGTLFFLTPVIGMRYEITKAIDFDIAYRGVLYFTGDNISGLENLFNITSDSRKWFPFKAKNTLTFGLTFNY